MKTIQKTTKEFVMGGVVGLCLFIAGCSGSSDDSDNPISYNPVGDVSSLSARITDVTILNASTTGEAPTVEFTVTDQDGNGVTRLTGMRYVIAKLVNATDGEPSYWQNYINTLATISDGDPGTEVAGSLAVQASAENDTTGGDGTLTELGGGDYSYTFATNLSAVTTVHGEALDVEYEPTLTHRVAIQISTTNDEGETVWTNPVYDFQPSTGRTTNLETREIVKTESCNFCHGYFTAHDDGRREAKFCVTCHNPQTVDPNSGNNLDFALMIHKIHSGSSLPSVVNGGESYIIWGDQNAENDYSAVIFPQETEHCDKCHDPADEDTPDASNYFTFSYERACGACHDDIVFDGSTPSDWQTAHSGGTTTDADCATCHGGSGATVDGRIAGVHSVDTEVQAAEFQFNIISITNTDPGDYPTITFSVTNTLTGETIDVTTDPAFTTTTGGYSTFAALIGWGTDDFTNNGSTSNYGQPINLNILTATKTNNGDGTFSVTSTKAIAADATGSGMVALQGHPAGVDDDGAYTLKLPVTNTIAYFTITDTSATSRRGIVDMDKCNTCHYNLSMHGSNRTGSIETCALCHNAAATDKNRRPASVGDTSDGKEEETVDLKYIIHAIHASETRENSLYIWGYGPTEHDLSETLYPNVEVNDCLTCHVEDAYTFPLSDDVLGTTTDTGASGTDQTDDLRVSPAAAACSSCHDSGDAQTHMEQNGSTFSDTQANITANDSESCSICHGEGKTADVEEVHGIE